MSRLIDANRLAKAAWYAAKAGTLSSYVGLYAGQASLGKIAARGDRKDRLDYFIKNVSKWSRRTIDKMGVDLSVHGYDPTLLRERNFLFVGNHLSYLDILVTSSIQPMVFVTSVDLGETRFFGPIAEMGGSIFVERRSRSTVARDIGLMADTLKSGHNVMIYPEGTSTDGAKVYPFKKALLASAIEAGVDVLPLVVKYTEIDGEPFGPQNRDKVCWYGDMTFFPHVVDLVRLKRIKAELHFLPPIEVAKVDSRHDLAERAHRAISAIYSGDMDAMLNCDSLQASSAP